MTVDTNVFLSRWPFRRLPYDDTGSLVRHLRFRGITQAWAASFDGVLHRDIAGVNLRVVHECSEHGDGLLLPVGTVNPTLPDWKEDIRRCAEEHRMRAIRLHPNYHSYELNDPRFAELLGLAEQYGLIVQLTIRMEDDRTHHPLMQVPDVDITPLPGVLEQHPNLRMIITNGLRVLVGAKLEPFASLENVYVEISMQEGVGGLEKLIKSFTYERVLFGSYFPFFNLEAALLKMEESDLGVTIRRAIATENSKQLLSE